MRAGVTGGHQAAPIWHDLMTVAHTDMNIPTIPGLAPHPRQVEEQQRLAALKAAQVAAGLDTPKAADSKSGSLMPDKTRAVLKSLVSALRKAEGAPEEPAATPASDKTGTPQPAPSGPSQEPQKDKAPEPPGRRASLSDVSKDDLTVPAALSATAPSSATRSRAGAR
jgi:penicillin-binding protein 1A